MRLVRVKNGESRYKPGDRIKELELIKFIREICPKKNQPVKKWLCKTPYGDSIIPEDYINYVSKKETHRFSRTNKNPEQATKHRLYRTYKRHANERVHNFNLTNEEFESFLNKNCHYCNTEPSNQAKFDNGREGFFRYNGIDRVDNTQGYNLKNCVTCCKICNLAKRDLTQEEFLNWIKKLKQYC